MNKELNDRLVEAAERMIESYDKAYETVHKLEGENASRMVWLVAVSGFAIIYTPTFLSYGKTYPFSPLLPWILTALLGVLAHWSHRSVATRNFELHSTRRELLTIFIINGPAQATYQALDAILTNKTQKLAQIDKAHSRITTLTTLLEIATFAAFIGSLAYFLWVYITIN
jgi:hypothetical protein